MNPISTKMSSRVRIRAHRRQVRQRRPVRRIRRRPSARGLVVSHVSTSPSPSVSCTFVLSTIALHDRQSGMSGSGSTRTLADDASAGSVIGVVQLSHLAPSALLNGLLNTWPLIVTRSDKSGRPDDLRHARLGRAPGLVETADRLCHRPERALGHAAVVDDNGFVRLRRVPVDHDQANADRARTVPILALATVFIVVGVLDAGIGDDDAERGVQRLLAGFSLSIGRNRKTSVR